MKPVKAFLPLLFALMALAQPAAAQLKDNPSVMAQIRMVLAAKGLSEQEVKDRLKSKGIDVDALPESEIMRNRTIIEQTVAELEAEKAAANQKRNEAPLGKPEVITTLEPAPVVSTKEARADVVNVTPTANPGTTDIYGHSLFRTGSLEIYRVSKDAAPPDAYIIAPGDRVNVLIFGPSQADLQYEVNPQGFIAPNAMPKIFLSGLTLKQARELVSKRFSIYYRFNPDQFALTLNTSRTLTVNIFGEVVKAGSYTTSALNTALNALAVGGGPTPFGSVRNIEIIRGSNRKRLDVYAFMRNPILQFEFFLQNNDIIYVPPAGKIITLEGSVNRPMRYELRENEGINELIDFAGGLRPEVFAEYVQLQRYENGTVVLKDYALPDIQSGKLKVELRNGDIVRLRSINSPMRDYVKMSGAVEYDGNYALTTTGTVKALLTKARLTPEAKTDQGFLIRKQPDSTERIITFHVGDILAGKVADIRLEREDEVLVYEQARFTDRFNISVQGEVRNPFERPFRFDAKLSLQEALGLAGGLKNTAASIAYIYRTDPFRQKRTEYIPVEVTSATPLKPGDRVVILNKDLYDRDATLTVTGEVNNPLEIRFDSSLALSDLIKLAGSTTLAANLDRVDVFRLKFSPTEAPRKELITVTVDEQFRPKGTQSGFTLQPYDYVVMRKVSEFTLNESVSITGEVKTEGSFVMNDREFYFSDLIRDAGGFTQFADLDNISLIRYVDSSGLLVFDAQKALKSPGQKKYDPILRPGDFVRVPKVENVVRIQTAGTRYVLGANQPLLQVNYQGNHSAAWYIRNFAGGFGKRADKKTLKAIRDNGLVDRTKSFLFIRNYPNVMYGDRIVMDLKEEKPKVEKKTVKEIDWDKAFTRILALGSTMAIILSVTK
jgi:protein involved in polysaccharide export with SLBB domain